MNQCRKEIVAMTEKQMLYLWDLNLWPLLQVSGWRELVVSRWALRGICFRAAGGGHRHRLGGWFPHGGSWDHLLPGEDTARAVRWGGHRGPTTVSNNTICRIVKFQFNVRIDPQTFAFFPSRRGDSVPTLERATKFNPMFESDPVTAQYYRRYDDDVPQYYSSSVSADGSKDLGSDEIRHIYQNTTLTKEVQKLFFTFMNSCSLFSLFQEVLTRNLKDRTIFWLHTAECHQHRGLF